MLTCSAPDGDQQLMARADGLAALGEMHGLVRDVVAVDKGELLTSTAL